MADFRITMSISNWGKCSSIWVKKIPSKICSVIEDEPEVRKLQAKFNEGGLEQGSKDKVVVGKKGWGVTQMHLRFKMSKQEQLQQLK